MVFAILMISVGLYVYSVFNGTPWEKRHHQGQMMKYLNEKYNTEFVFFQIDYNYLSETYQGYATPKNYSDLLFITEEDRDAPLGYSDNYPKVIWNSELSSAVKVKIKELFPNLNQSTFEPLPIKDKAMYFGPHIPTYEEFNVSILATSIPIDINANWSQVNQEQELKKMQELSKFLKNVHFPVLVEVRYYETEMNEKAKVFFITEEGEILPK
ncbi:hypothetical protein BTR25_09350 [Bacillus sp. MRMR6]|nr:hypothetical protein BTR25_09350 [Bacillus sp. MRMR6]